MVETGSNAASTTALMANVKGGNGTIPAGLTTVNVAHGLSGGAPTGSSVTPTGDSVGVDIFIHSVDATNIRVDMDFPQATDVTFTWTAVR
jgi:hypothetical protein